MTILDSLMATVTGQSMKAEADRKHRARREQQAQALDAANALAEKQRKPLVERKQAAERELATSQRALAAAQAKSHAAKLLLSQHDQRAERERTRQEKALLDCAGDELAAFLEKIRQESNRLCNWRRIEERREMITIGYDIASGPIRRLGTTDNREQLGSRIRALADAAHEAEHLASTKADYTGELQKLWDTLPKENA